MFWLDIVLVGVCVGFALFGFYFGFFHTLGSLLGTALGFFLASRYSGYMAEWLMNVTGWEGNASRLLMFVVAFLLINRLVGILFWFIDKILSIVNHLPLIGLVNRILGAVFGFLEGMITIGLIFYFARKLPLTEEGKWLLQTSTVGKKFESITLFLFPLWPLVVKCFRTITQFVESTIHRFID